MLRLAPGTHHLSQNREFTDMIGIVIRKNEGFAQNRVAVIAVRDGREEISRGIFDDGLHVAQIAPESIAPDAVSPNAGPGGPTGRVAPSSVIVAEIEPRAQ